MHRVPPSPSSLFDSELAAPAGRIPVLSRDPAVALRTELKKLLPADLLVDPEQHRIAPHALSAGSVPEVSAVAARKTLKVSLQASRSYARATGPRSAFAPAVAER